MKVKVTELRRAAIALFDHLERSGHDDIEVDRDYYWIIPDGKLYAVYEEPTGFTIGQLSDDLNEIRKINAGHKPPIAYALIWLSSLLRLVGAKVVS